MKNSKNRSHGSLEQGRHTYSAVLTVTFTLVILWASLRDPHIPRSKSSEIGRRLWQAKENHEFANAPKRVVQQITGGPTATGETSLQGNLDEAPKLEALETGEYGLDVVSFFRSEKKEDLGVSKLDTQLLSALDAVPPLDRGLFRGEEAWPVGPRRDASGRVQLYVEVTDMSTFELNALEDTGLTIEFADSRSRSVQGWVTPSEVARLEENPNVISMSLPHYAVTRRGSVTTEGDSLLGADSVRALPAPGPYSGAGAKIGIISNGADHHTTAVQSGDLPQEGITLNPTLVGASDEGTAMMEIVHDIAPDADLFFAGITTSLEMVQAFDWMVAMGCDIICDDLGFPAEPYFEDGNVGNAVRQLTEKQGIIYCSAAGNEAQVHYQGDYRDSGIALPNDLGSLHSFRNGPGADIFLDGVASPGATMTIVMQWNDRFGASGNDYDLFLFEVENGELKGLLDSSKSPQIGGQKPIEYVRFTNTANHPLRFALCISKYSGWSRTLEVMGFVSAGVIKFIDDDAVPSDSLFGHPAIRNVIACAAIAADQPGLAEIADYSSRGPVTISFPEAETRHGPFITALDGVSVSGAGGFPVKFSGTSAAAPHVAAICALMMEKHRTADSDLIRSALAETAYDRGPIGYDPAYGYGLVNALDAVLRLEKMEEPPRLLPGTLTSYGYAMTAIVRPGRTYRVDYTSDLKHWHELLSFVAAEPLTELTHGEALYNSNHFYRITEIDIK